MGRVSKKLMRDPVDAHGWKGEGKMRVIIDRFEGEYAVVELEDGSMAYLAAKLLPGAREGDVVLIKIGRASCRERG